MKRETADLENPQFGKRIWDIDHNTGRVIANFVLKYSNFCHHGNRGSSKTSCNDTTKSADLKTPLWYQNQGIISYGQPFSLIVSAAPVTSLVHMASEHRCYTLLF